MQVKVCKEGVIVIPAEVRKLSIAEGSVLELEVECDKIVLKKTMTLLDATALTGTWGTYL